MVLIFSINTSYDINKRYVYSCEIRLFILPSKREEPIFSINSVNGTNNLETYLLKFTYFSRMKISYGYLAILISFARCGFCRFSKTLLCSRCTFVRILNDVSDSDRTESLRKIMSVFICIPVVLVQTVRVGNLAYSTGRERDGERHDGKTNVDKTVVLRTLFYGRIT